MKYLSFILGNWIYLIHSLLVKSILRLKGFKIGKNFKIRGVPLLKLNSENLDFECFILNDPFKKKNDLESLIKKIDLNKTPYLNIKWKVEKDLKGIDESTKKGHDYAARVFVVKKTGATPLSNRAMNYVFSSNEDVDVFHPSPYTKKSIDYVLATTKEHLNEWVTVKVNVKDHFKKFHNLDLDEINGIAIMADTDNSKLSSVAYYQNIYFSAE